MAKNPTKPGRPTKPKTGPDGTIHIDAALPPHADTHVHVDTPVGPHVDTGGGHIDAHQDAMGVGPHEDFSLPHVDASVPPHGDTSPHIDTPGGPHIDVSRTPTLKAKS